MAHENVYFSNQTMNEGARSLRMKMRNAKLNLKEATFTYYLFIYFFDLTKIRGVLGTARVKRFANPIKELSVCLSVLY